MKLLLPGVPASPVTRSAATTAAAPLPSQTPVSAPDADVGRFLHVEVKHEHSVPARSRSGVQPLLQTAVESGDNDVVELEFEGGFRQWISVAQLAVDMEASGQRSADGAVPVPLQPIMLHPQQSRGVTGWVLKGDPKVLGISPVDAAVDEIQSRVLASFEKKTVPEPGLWRLRAPQDPAEQLMKPFTEPEKPALIFIHGTASSIGGSFSGLAEKSEKLADVWADLKTQYGDRIFGFQHPTLSVSPVVNALELIKLIPEGARLHLVSHSRGGLVGELLCLNGLDDRQIKAFQYKASAKDAAAPANEQPERRAAREAEIAALRELATKLHERKLKIERFVRVACPARGTILASGRLDLFLSLLTSAIGLLANRVPALGAVHDFTKAVVLEIARRRTRPDELPGFEAQMPDSPLIHLLNQTNFASTADLAVIAGDIEAGNLFAGDNLAKLLGVFATDLFYWGDHDIVVNTSSMDGGLSRQNGVRQLIDQGTVVSHFNYFHNPRTRDALSRWLRRKDGAPDDAEFVVRPSAAVSRATYRASRDTTGFPVLFILPGIMGTLLGEGKAPTKEDLLWLNQERLALGGLRQLELTGSNSVVVVPIAAVGENYDAISRHFSAGYEVEVFGYDWRQSMIESGKLLAKKVRAQVEKGRVVRLLAHSMGGLIARAMIASDHRLWDKVCAGGGRLVQLGTPNRGCYAAPRMLWGVDEAVRMLDLIDPAPLDELCAIIARWPGVLEMMPEEAPADKPGELAFGRFFDPGWWRRHRPGAAPSSEALDSARRVREMLNSAPLKNAVYVAGCASETPGGMVLDDGQLPVWTAAEGDGTVPYALARLQRSEDTLGVYFLDAVHGDLANHPPGFEAIRELLAKGQTNQLPTTLPMRRGTGVREGVLRDDMPLLCPREEDVLAAALHSRPRRRGLEAPGLPILEVTVFHGDLRLSRYPVMIGHYLGDKIVHAEKTLDEQLEGALTQHQNLGLFTGAVGQAEVVLVPSCQPPGAILLGLGEVGDLSARQLERSVRTAVLRYGMRLAKKPLSIADDDSEPKHVPAGVSVLLIGTNGGSSLRIIDSAAAIIAGVRDANRLLRDALPPAERVCIEVLHFIELYETLATRSLYAVQRVCARFSAGLCGGMQAVRVAPFLRSLGLGRFQPSLGDLDTGWWPRVIITGEKNAAGNLAGLRFAMASDRGAGIEERVARTQARHIESRIQRGITSPNFDVTAAAALFELLVPESLKVRLDTASDNFVLLLDEQSARIPWEMLTRRSAEGDGGLDHLALRIGIVRQFRTATVAMRKPASRALKAVVIGDTKNEFAELPGAQQEAKDVAALLTSHGVAATPLLKAEGDEALDAILAPDYRILHIAAHGQYDTEVERSGVVLGADRFFSALEVESMPAGPEVVFINCCHLGLLAPGSATALVSDKDYEAHLARLRQIGNLAASLAFAFIKKGTRIVIAAGWAVDDAAGSFFATTFYKAILAGECFGEAVLHARQATAEAHPRVNTWSAYQCYGSPDFRFELERDGAPPATAAKRDGGSPFVGRTEFLHAIRELRLETTVSQSTSALLKNARERLEGLAQMVPAHWQDGEMLAEIGFTFVEMREWDQARHWLGLAIRHGNATASLRAIEQLSNAEDRAAKSLDPAAAAALRENAGARLALLRPFGETAERHALQGGWIRRRMDAVSESEKNALLREARDEYRKADELTRRERSEIDPYPAINWLTYAWLLLDGAPSSKKNATDRQKKKRGRKTAAVSTDDEIDLATLRRELATVRGAIENRLLTKSDIWTRVDAPDALLLNHLVEGSFAHGGNETKLRVIAAYRSALRAGVQAGQKSSITGHLDFLIDCLRTHTGQAATVAALTEIRDSIEKI